MKALGIQSSGCRDSGFSSGIQGLGIKGLGLQEYDPLERDRRLDRAPVSLGEGRVYATNLNTDRISVSIISFSIQF